MNDIALIDQTTRMVTENQNLRVKSDNDDITINLMRSQYDALAGEVKAIRDKAASDVARTRDRAEREISDMRIERDQAVRAFKEIDTLLLQAADLIMQALRAREGNGTPEIMPKAMTPHIVDARIPEVTLQS